MSLRSKVLQAFKNVHRARLQVFHGDIEALSAAREKINSEFKKHKSVSEKEEVEELLKVANESAEYLKTSIVQAKLKEENLYEVRITQDTALKENHPFKEGECSAKGKT